MVVVSPKPAFLHIQCYYFLKHQHYPGLVLYSLMLLFFFFFLQKLVSRVIVYYRQTQMTPANALTLETAVRQSQELKFFIFH